jgi:hypothetical protein
LRKFSQDNRLTQELSIDIKDKLHTIISNIFAEEVFLPQTINHLWVCNLQYECHLVTISYCCLSQDEILVDKGIAENWKLKLMLTKKKSLKKSSPLAYINHT